MNPEIGIIRRDEIPVWQAPRSVAASEAFASACEQRYAPHNVIASRADMALAWQPPAEINYFQDAPRMEISPVVTIEERTAGERYVFASAPKDIARAAQPVASLFGEAEASALFERLFSRHRRVAAFDPPWETARPRNAEGRALEPLVPPPGTVEKTVARAAAAVTSAMPVETAPVSRAARESLSGAPAPAPAPSVRDAGWGTPFAFPETPKPFVALPPPEIKRVAEQVMREIDRRVIARKERMGKR